MFRRSIAVLAVLATLLVTVQHLSAANIIVDINHPAADDNAGDGSAEKPFKSIGKAFSRATPGDTVLVMPGDYGPRVNLHKSGEKDKPITVRSAVPHGAKIAGFDIAPWDRANSFLRIEGFTIEPGETSGAGIDISLGENIEIIGNRFVQCGIGGGRIRKGTEEERQARNIRIAYNYMTDMAIAISISGHDFLIESNEIFSLHLRGPGDADHARLFGIGHTVRYNYFHGTKPENIGKAHVDIIQFFDQNGDILRDLTVHDNVFFDFHQMFMATAYKAEEHAANMTFTRNIASSPWGAWGVCAAGIPGVKVLNNTFYDITWFGTGISRERGEGIIRNNIYQKIGQAIQVDRGATAVSDHNMVFQAKPGDAGKDNLIDVDPKMIGPAVGNFRLAADSPAINAGVDKATIGALDYPNVYYVDPQHPGASDDGFGYAGRPYSTIAKALSAAGKGETILLRGGTYREAIVANATAAGVTVRPMKEQSPVIISGADLIIGWERTGETWSAPLATKPSAVLCNGATWADFNYNADRKQITLTGGGDPRLHVFEAIVRERAIDLTNVSGMTIEMVQAVNTFGEAVLPGESNHVTVLGRPVPPFVKKGEKPFGDLEGPVALTQIIYTTDSAPQAPALDNLPRKKSVTQYGITWTFDREVPVGRFITGDYYVVGPVTVIQVDPTPIQGIENLRNSGWEIIKRDGVDEERYGEKVARNGSMRNPTGQNIKAQGGKFGFDSRLPHGYFDGQCFEAPPLELKVGDTLVSTISNPDLDDFSGYGQTMLAAAVLTCLENPVPADAFRPSYADTGKRVYLARNLNRELLYNQPRPKSAPETEIWIRRFHRPWLDFTDWGYGSPMRNQPRYGQGYVNAVSTVSLMLHLDYPPEQKEKLLLHYVQYGIDLAGLLRSGFDGWPGHGGFGAGRRWTLIFTGLMLGDEDMQRPNNLNPKARFAEVDQTSWGRNWHGSNVLFESHPAWRPDPSEKAHPREWAAGHLQSENYRIANTSVEWPGQALAARMMRAEALWNHDPFFAYVDRWMNDDLADIVRVRVMEMAKARGVDVEKDPPQMPWYVRAPKASPFAQAMWDKYRHDLPPIKPAMRAWARTEEVPTPAVETP